MAKRVIQRIIDDLDGQPADETVAVGLDGVLFVIDLSAANAERLRRALAPFAAAAVKIGRGPVRAAGRRTAVRRAAAGVSTPRRTAEDRARLASVRAWAHANGRQLKDRGRIPGEVLAAYEHAQQAPPEPAPPPKRTRRTKTVPPAQFSAP